ncbi:MAG: OprD family outer membrane porin, partial [Woeseiaceae bacterium]
MNQSTVPIRRFVLTCAAAILVLATPGYGSEYRRAEEIAPESAEGAVGGIESIDNPPSRRPRLGLLIDLLADRSPFWRDSSLDLSLRAYNFRRDDDNSTLAEASTLGTDLTFQSGKWRDRLSITTSWHTSNKINAPQGSGDTGLLGPNQSNLSVISRAYLDASLTKSTGVRLYRQDFGMPYINRQDSRMIPNTFEAYVVRHPGERLVWIAGQITKMKKRDSEDFVPMAEAAGVAGDDSGTTIAGARYTFEN